MTEWPIWFWFGLLTFTANVDTQSVVGIPQISPGVANIRSDEPSIQTISIPFTIVSGDRLNALMIEVSNKSQPNAYTSRQRQLCAAYQPHATFVSLAGDNPEVVDTSGCRAILSSASSFYNIEITLWIKVRYHRIPSNVIWSGRLVRHSGYFQRVYEDIKTPEYGRVVLVDFPPVMEANVTTSASGDRCPQYSIRAYTKTDPRAETELDCGLLTVKDVSRTYRDYTNGLTASVVVDRPMVTVTCRFTATITTPKRTVGGVTTTLDNAHSNDCRRIAYTGATLGYKLKTCFDCDCSYQWSMNGRELLVYTNRSRLPLAAVISANGDYEIMAKVCEGVSCVTSRFCINAYFASGSAPTPGSIPFATLLEGTNFLTNQSTIVLTTQKEASSGEAPLHSMMHFLHLLAHTIVFVLT